MAGRVLAKGGVTCLDGELARAGARKLGPRDKEIAAAGRWKAFPWPLILGNPGIKLRHCYLRRAFWRSVSPHLRGERKIKAQLARRRGNEAVWLFESVDRKI